MRSLKPKKCKVCGEPYIPFNSFAKACSPECAIEFVRREGKKEIKQREREYNQETKRRKDNLKSLNDWIAEAQTVFNKFIRERDKEQPCISCGREHVEWTTGGSWDCGHYKSRGAFPELKFCELNAYKQCKSCNAGSAKYAKKGYTVGQEYTERLILRIGQDKVDWLNGPHKPKNYTIDDIKAIKAEYQLKFKELKNE